MALGGGHGWTRLSGIFGMTLLLAGCGSTPDLVAGTCRDGPRDAAGRGTQVCTPRGQGDPVRVVRSDTGSFPVFDGGVSGQPALAATAHALALAPPQFDPRRDQVLWPGHGPSPIIVTFAAADPGRGGAVSTLRVVFRPADGAVLGYRRVPRR